MTDHHDIPFGKRMAEAGAQLRAEGRDVLAPGFVSEVIRRALRAEGWDEAGIERFVARVEYMARTAAHSEIAADGLTWMLEWSEPPDEDDA